MADEEKITFATILERYDALMDYVRDIGQKLIALQFTYIALYVGHTEIAHAQYYHRYIVLPAYAFIGVGVALMFWANYRRLKGCRQGLSEHFAPRMASAGLLKLGILPSDPGRPVLMWSLPFLLIHFTFVGIAFFVADPPIWTGGR